MPESRLVGGDESLVVRQRVDVDRLAIHIDQRNLGGGGSVRHRLGCRRVNRVHDDRIDARGDEVLDLVELLGHVVLRILNLQIDAVHAFRLLDHAVPQNGQEVVVEQGHGYADVCSKCGAGHERCHGGCENKFLHFFNSSVRVSGGTL